MCGSRGLYRTYSPSSSPLTDTLPSHKITLTLGNKRESEEFLQWSSFYGALEARGFELFGLCVHTYVYVHVHVYIKSLGMTVYSHLSEDN